MNTDQPNIATRRRGSLSLKTEPALPLATETDVRTPESTKPGVTIVVPCFNEEPALSSLNEKLHSVKWMLEEKYEVFLILADDGSTDKTWQIMLELFGAEPNCTLVKQPRNLGVAATILAGIRRAGTEVVCSIDCDCTYDPLELDKLLPMLTSGVDLVTGSPYHPLGRVWDVPRWRLALSRTASSLYRRVLRNKLYTYTSCFRVYRRSAVLKLDLNKTGFLGVAELIGKLDLQGSAIVECPTTLKTRVLGTSKMKIFRVLLGHLYLLCQFLTIRTRQKLFDRRPIESRTAKLEDGRGGTTDWAQY
jgi:glycosyltransferase involved in cell wall biosynthesis